MRFSPTSDWSIAANAAHRQVVQTVEVKKTTDISESLSTGTWVDITQFLDSPVDVDQRIEYELGQFSSSSITLTCSKGIFSGGGIQWFKDNVFNASEYEYIEIRVKMVLKMGSITTADTVYIFSGFVDKAEVEYNELLDQVTFTAYTADELGNRIAGENISTQYVSDDIDGIGTDGLVMPSIPGIFVKNANVASYQLKAGLHTLEYEYNSGTEQMRLDGGDWLTLRVTDGTDTLVSEDGLEKIEIYVDVSELSTQTYTLTDYVIVTVPGTTLPNQPYYGLSVKELLRKLYEKVGITDDTFDTLQFDSWDANPKISFYDTPPQDASKNGKQYAAVDNGTDIFVGVGDSVYKRIMSTDTYTLVTTKTGYVVYRLWYNSRNNDLWIWYVGAGDTYVRVYDLSGASYNEVSVSSNTSFKSAELVDYNYTGSSYLYGLVYVNNSAHSVRIVSDTATDSLVFSAATLGVDATTVFVFWNGQFVYFYDNDGVNVNFHRLSIDPAGTWTDDGSLFALTESYNQWAALHKSENRVYYLYNSGGKYIKSHTTSSAAVATVSTLSAGDNVQSMMYLNSKVYFTLAAGTNYYKGSLYSLVTNTQTLVHSLDNGPHQRGWTMMYFGGILYGLDILRRIWRYSETINMYVNRPKFDGITVRDAISKTLQAYNLIGIISSHKKFFVYRRGDDTGVVQNSGNSITVNVTNATDITQVQNAYQKVSIVEVSNGTTVYNFDGTTYQTTVLSDAKKFSLQNELIPDDLVKDVCTYLFAFYNAAHDKYIISVNAALLQNEVMDGAAVTFATTRIAKSDTGLITAQRIDHLGNMELEVLF